MSNVFPFDPPVEPDSISMQHEHAAREEVENITRGGGLHVTVYPYGGEWHAHFSDNSNSRPVDRGGMTKETAVQMGAEAVLTWGAELTVRNTPLFGGAA